MGEIIPKHYLYGIVAFVFFIGAGVVLMGELNVHNDLASDAEISAFNSTFNKLTDIQDSVNTLESGVTTGDPEEGFSIFGVLNSLISRSWQTIKLLFTSFSFMNDAYNGVNKYVGSNILPSWIPGLVITLITIMFIFYIFSLIFQKD